MFVHIYSWEMISDFAMTGRAFVVAKEAFNYRSGNIFTLCEWLNDKKQFCLFKFHFIGKQLYLERNFNH